MKFLVLIEKHQNAIIGALIIHVLIFVWLNIQNISFYVIQPKEKILATLDFTESKNALEKPKQEQKKYFEKAKETNAASNYEQNKEISASQKKDLAEKIMNDVKNYEQSQFKDLSSDNPILKKKQVESSKNTIEKPKEFKSLAKTSNATAKYFCKGRNMISQKIPSYLCDATGLVRLNIKVNSKGLVTDCKVDNSLTTTQNECLIENALGYANRWRFNQDFSKTQKQSGWIEFIYISHN